MRVGVVFPQTEIGADPGAVRAYAQAAENAGYRHLLAYDHVLGAHPDRPDGFRVRYTHEAMFHEPFVLFGHLAAVTSELELVTGVLVLPQRQTALVAKQAAQVDLLSGGRLRLGVGVGWNAVEYEALGENFRDRGRRIEEQVSLLRRLWREPVITFKGHYHTVTKAGINPMPPRPDIPIWMGGMDERVLHRIGRSADGWFPQLTDPAALAEPLGRIHAAASAAGRKPEAIGVEARVTFGGEGADVNEAVALAHAWRDAGATHLSVNTMGRGLRTPADHIDAIEHFKECYDEAGDR